MNMNGYWKNEKLTAEVLVNGFVLTNDIGFVDEDGYLYVIGRRDDVINFNGIKISPSEIEDVVIQFPGIAECACVGVPDPVAGQIPKLFVVLEEERTLDMEYFLQFLNAHIDGTKMPKGVEQLNSMPRTYNGKLDRKKLAGM
jgi:acyl-coenzyme A synthetase/AMP-(fatty) acid ligase